MDGSAEDEYLEENPESDEGVVDCARAAHPRSRAICSFATANPKHNVELHQDLDSRILCCPNSSLKGGLSEPSRSSYCSSTSSATSVCGSGAPASPVTAVLALGSLSVGDHCDVLDSSNRWCEGEVCVIG